LEAGLQVPVLAGTHGYFAELNRPNVQSTSTDGVAFPLAHTVHACDVATIAENISSIADMADTARRRWHSSQIAVAPLALFYPLGDANDFPTQLLAPWLTATLIHAALAQVETVTLSTDVLVAMCSAGSGATAAVLGPLFEFRGWRVRSVTRVLARDLHAIVLENPVQRSRYVLAANLSHKGQTLTLDVEPCMGSTCPEERSTLEVCGYGVTLVEVV
jgi:hypothetical protein